MNSNFHAVDFYNLAQFTRLIIFAGLTPVSTSIQVSHRILISFACLVSFFWDEKRLKYLLMVFTFIHPYLHPPSIGRTRSNVKACNQIQFFTLEYMRTCDELDNVRLN